MDSLFKYDQLRAPNPLMSTEELFDMLRYPNSSQSSTTVERAQYKRNIEHDIQLYDSFVNQIRAKQTALRRELACYNALDSPIRKCPPEILRQIFGFVVDRNTFGGKRDDMLSKSPAFVLSTVCRRWRDIALEAPELWTNMDIWLDPRAIRPLKLALKRSRKRILTLRIRSLQEDHGEADEDIFDLLIEEVPRWGKISLDVWCEALDAHLFHVPLDMPALKSMECSKLEAEDLFSGTFAPPPKFRHLSLSYEDGTSDIEENFPISTLHHLELTYDGDEDLDWLCHCLRETPSLESLHFTATVGASYVAYDEIEDEKRVVSLNLQSLEVVLEGHTKGVYPILDDMLHSLTLPALTTFSLIVPTPSASKQEQDGYLTGGEWPRNVMSDFLDRTLCSITTLHLSGVPFSELDLTHLFRRTPSLHTLTLREFMATEDDIGKPVCYQQARRTVTRSLLKGLVLPTLTYPEALFLDAQHPFLPKLVSLTLAVQCHFDADEVFVDMVRSRWESRVLRTVVLYVLNRQMEEEIYEPLKKMDEEGLMVSVFKDWTRIV